MTLMVPSKPSKPGNPDNPDPDLLPKWRRVYDKLLQRADFGDIITFEALDEALDRPFRQNRTPLRLANEYLGAMRKRWLAPVRGKGYRVITAEEHAKIAEGHKRKGRRQFERMVQVMNFTDLDALTDEQRAVFAAQNKINTLLFAVAVSHEQRLQKIEDALQAAGLI